MLDGALEKLSVTPGEPARYRLGVRPGESSSAEDVDLNSLLNKELRIEFQQKITCAHCARDTRKSYGGGYCYPCFRTLARCDLCVVSPARCHYDAGTCREPEWGESFCMQPHLVYLANSSAPKVGITRPGNSLTRWLDQGATQGLVIAETLTRHLAGVLEAQIARQVGDRTDWRAMARGDAEPADLAGLRDRVRGALEGLPPGVRWLPAEPVQELRFPVAAYPGRPERLRLDRTPVVAGALRGVKGQYLLFDHGVFSVTQHRSYHVRITFQDQPAASDGARPSGSQLELLS